MELNLNSLKAEKKRLHELREAAWAEVNQMLGAENQLDMLISVLEKNEAKNADDQGYVEGEILPISRTTEK